jgi:hypothetical protein
MRFNRFNRTILHFVFAFLFASTSLAGVANAQQYLGTIQGAATDSTGAKVPDATVVAEETTTHFKTTVKSNSSGSFTFAALNPGTYTVTITAAGFKTVSRSQLTLTAGQFQQVDFNLSLGEATETVEVTGENSILDTGSANVATTLSQQEVVDLPNEGRDPFVLADLAAGVTLSVFQAKSSTATNPFSGAAVQITSGGQAGHNRLTIDGIPNDPPERFSGATYAGFTPSPESVQEVKIGTSAFDAQVGHGNGTVTNVVIRSGANRIHGSVYTVVQDTYLNANLYDRVPNQNLCFPGTTGCTNTITPTRRNNDQLNQSGFVVSGPVWIPKLYNGKDKTFFMVAFERYASHIATPYTGFMPDTRFRNGDFGELCQDNFDATGQCVAGSGRQLYDPNYPVASASTNRTVYYPFNKITTNSLGVTRALNPAGVALMSYLPCQNRYANGCDAGFYQGGVIPTFNYTGIQNSFPNTYPSLIGRLDQAIGQRNKLNIILFHTALTQSTPLEGFPKGVGPSGTNEGGYKVSRRTMGGSIDDVQQIGSTMVLDSRFGITWHPFSLRNVGDQNFDLSSIAISPAGLPYQTFPGITNNADGPTLTSGAGGSSNNSQASTGMNGSLEEVLTKTIGHHSVRVGFEGNLLNYNAQTSESGFTGMVFDRTFTQRQPGNGDTTSGNALASLLAGNFNAAQYSINPSFALHQIYMAPFVQDDWRVSSKLTLNLGIRYDYESPFTERYNKFVNGFNPSVANPIVPGTFGGLTFATPSNRHPYAQDLNNIQPRVGFSYQAQPGTVIRFGYGRIYFNTLETPVGTGYSSVTGGTSTGTGGSNVNTAGGYVPFTTLDKPFPLGVTLPTGNTLGYGTGVGTAISYIDPNHQQPKTDQISVSVQQQFPGNLQVQIAYVNNRPSQLEVSQDINVLPQQYYSTSMDPVANLANQTFLNAAVANPMAGKIPNNPTLNAATIARNLLLKPFPEYSSVTNNYQSIGYQRFDAMEIQVSKPMKHHFSFQGNFTWDKLINHTSFANNYGPGTALTKIGDPGPNHFGNVFGTFELPKFATRPAYQRLIIGGWKLNAILRAENGSLIGAPGSVDQIGDPLAGAPRNFTRMFNTCYETQTAALVPTTTAIQGCDATSSTPAFRQRYSFTTQVNPIYINERQRVFPLADASLFKQFVIHEGTSLELRGEFFNIGNRPNFGGPGTGLNSSTYGKVTLTQVNDARIGQITARINF